MQEKQKVESQTMTIGFFSGQVKQIDQIDEDGEFCRRYTYSLVNSKSGEVLCGIHGEDFNGLTKQINQRVQEYYESHQQEFQELVKANENN